MSLFDDSMRRRLRGLLLLILASSAGVILALQDASRPRYDRSQATPGQEVMWLKLDLAHDLLEALFMRDIDVIGASLDELQELSQDHSWFESDSEAFRARSSSFRNGVERMSRAVQGGDMDVAQSAYFDVLRNCFACHRALDAGPE